MKRFFAVLLTLLLVCGFAGCADRTPTGGGGQEGGGQTGTRGYYSSTRLAAESFVKSMDAEDEQELEAGLSGEDTGYVLDTIDNYKLFESLGGELSIEFLSYSEERTSDTSAEGTLRYRVRISYDGESLLDLTEDAKLSFAYDRGKGWIIDKVLFRDRVEEVRQNTMEDVAREYIDALESRNYNRVLACFDLSALTEEQAELFRDYFRMIVARDVSGDYRYSLLNYDQGTGLTGTIYTYISYSLHGWELGNYHTEVLRFIRKADKYYLLPQDYVLNAHELSFSQRSPEDLLRTYLYCLSQYDADGLIQLYDTKDLTESQRSYLALVLNDRVNALKLVCGEFPVKLMLKNFNLYGSGGFCDFEIMCEALGERAVPASFDFETEKIGARWFFLFTGVSEPEPDPGAPDTNTVGMAVDRYFELLNAEDVAGVMDLLYREGLTSSQDEALFRFYGYVVPGSVRGIAGYERFDCTVLFEQAGYCELAVNYRVSTYGQTTYEVVFLDFVNVNGMWKMLPEDYAFDYFDKPDYSRFSPKYAIIRYLNLLRTDRLEEVIDCFDYSELTPEQYETFYEKLKLYATDDYVFTNRYTLVSWTYTVKTADYAGLHCIANLEWGNGGSPGDSSFDWECRWVGDGWKMMPERWVYW